MRKHNDLFYVAVLSLVLVAAIVYLWYSGRAWDRQFASYRKEVGMAALVSQMPATAIPARDRSIVVAMRDGKRVTNANLNRLSGDTFLYIYAQKRRKAMFAWVHDHYIARQKRTLIRLLRTYPNGGEHAASRS